jgi:arylformamidase
MGHSAGGHITEMMMNTNWNEFSNDFPADLLKAGVPISPLSYLEPVRLTEILNTNIRMNAAEAEAESPLINHPPSTNASQLVILGGNETEGFHREAHMYVDALASDDRAIEMCIVPDADHFDELNVMAERTNPVFSKTLRILRSTTKLISK